MCPLVQNVFNKQDYRFVATAISLSHTFISDTQMEKIFSHAWRGRHGCETKEELEQLQERQSTPEEIQGQFIDDDQVFLSPINILIMRCDLHANK